MYNEKGDLKIKEKQEIITNDSIKRGLKHYEIKQVTFAKYTIFVIFYEEENVGQNYLTYFLFKP